MTQLEAPAPATRRLVIVEDEGILALDIQRHLTRAGFDVRGVVGDSDSALALVEAERPDLVLMDIRIQGERDGIETAATLRSRFDVPVVYLTAHSDPKTMERAQQTDPVGYLLKPFKKPDLENVVSIALARWDNERKLRRREEALSVTLSCIGEAIVTTNETGEVTYLNVAAERLAGRRRCDAINLPLGEVLSLRGSDGGPLGEDPVKEARAHGRVEFESTLGSRTLAGTAVELRHGATSFGAVLALRDLTDLLVTRKQLEFAERLSALGTLAAGVAHEVNNPLSVVISNLEFALQGDLPHDAREALAEAVEGAQRVAHIVGDLRALSRPQSEALRPVEPGQVLGSALAFTRGHWRGVAGVALELDAVPGVMAAPTRLAQVFVNLIINAVQAMETVSQAHVLSLCCSTSAHGEAVLEVRDTGEGIPEALRERIFEPFFTTKPLGKGTGLGLAVSRSIVENQGGRLEVSAGPGGVGTSFRVILPAVGLVPPVPLRAWWVGPPSPERAVLEQVPGWEFLTGDEPDLAGRFAQRDPQVVLLCLPEPRAGALCLAQPELEARALRVGDRNPVGLVTLRQPFDARSLGAFVRRTEATP